MSFWHKLFGRKTSPERIRRLWEEATKLGRTDGERRQAIGIYTELLTIIESGIDGTYKLNDETCDVCPIFRNRAVAYRGLKNYSAALEDLARELEIAQRRVGAAGKLPADVILADEMRVLKCQQIIAEIQDRQRGFAP